MMNLFMCTLKKAEAEGKIWLEPVIKIAYMYRFSAREEKQIMKIVIDNLNLFKKKWNEYFV